jgi:TonB family protein
MMRDFDLQSIEEPRTSGPPFALLPEARSRRGYFGISFLAQILLLVALANTPIVSFTPVLIPAETRDQVQWVAPKLLPPASAATVVTLRESPKSRPEVDPLLELPKQVPIEVARQKVDVAEAAPPTLPRPDSLPTVKLPPNSKLPRVVVTGCFGGACQPADEKKPQRQVQSGSFGDANGVPVSAERASGPTIAKVGSLDLLEASDSSTGQAGAKGVPHAVASAGFESGIATEDLGGDSRGQGGVRSTNFDTVGPTLVEPTKRQIPSTGANETPVSLLSKPRPTYTLEARQHRIKGEVELDVEFTATGQLHVLRVLQGLGYGLDEAAVKAAEQVRFAPARRDGQPVDSHGRLRVVFRLS